MDIYGDVLEPTELTLMELLEAVRHYDASLEEMEIPHIEICGDGSGCVSYREIGNGRKREYSFIGIDEAIAWLRSDSRQYDWD